MSQDDNKLEQAPDEIRDQFTIEAMEYESKFWEDIKHLSDNEKITRLRWGLRELFKRKETEIFFKEKELSEDIENLKKQIRK